VRDATVGKGEDGNTGLKVPGQCSLVLLVEARFETGSEEAKALGTGLCL
jgi:hypothetical protein